MKFRDQEIDLIDPFNELLDTRGSCTLSSSDMQLDRLSLFQRGLLTLDGTVTRYLEACSLEPVEVIRLNQCHACLPDEHAWLQTPAGTAVIKREVLLRGERSTVIYAYALSLLVISRLPDSLLQGLDAEKGSVGRVLLGNQVESRREMLWYGRQHLNGLSPELSAQTGDSFLSRTYRIITGGQPVILISEKFPENMTTPPPIR